MLRSPVCNMKQAVQSLATEISRGAASGSSSRLFLDRPSMDGHAQGPFFSAVASVFLQFVEMSHSFCVPISSVAICMLISCNGSFSTRCKQFMDASSSVTVAGKHTLF